MPKGYINIQFLSHYEKALLGLMTLQFMASICATTLNCSCACAQVLGSLAFLGISMAIHFTHGFRFLYLFSALRQIIYLVNAKTLTSEMILPALCFALNLLSIVLVLHCSKIYSYEPTGKYEHVGHREFRLKSGSKTWVSVYYPC